jgi:hypothetical protein
MLLPVLLFEQLNRPIEPCGQLTFIAALLSFLLDLKLSLSAFNLT